MLRQRFEKLIPTNQNAPHAFTLQFCTRDTLPVASFDLKLFFTHLATKQLGAVTMFSERVSSTQSILADHFSSVNDRLVFVAAQQSSGRGRGGNSWTSPRGCLMFSFKTQSQNGTHLAFLQYLISLAVCDAVGELPCLSHARAQQLRSHVRIKWPNDIYTDDGKKIGGVLCQSTYINGTFNLLIGMFPNICCVFFCITFFSQYFFTIFAFVQESV
jgi:biotin--protein ligase